MHKSSLKARLLQIRLSTLLIATFIAAWLLFVNVRAKNEIHEYRPSCGGAPQQISLENERGWPLTFSAQLRALDEFTSIEPNELLNGKYLAFDAAISFSIVVLLAAATEAFFRYYETRKNW